MWILLFIFLDHNWEHNHKEIMLLSHLLLQSFLKVIVFLPVSYFGDSGFKYSVFVKLWLQ